MDLIICLFSGIIELEPKSYCVVGNTFAGGSLIYNPVFLETVSPVINAYNLYRFNLAHVTAFEELFNSICISHSKGTHPVFLHLFDAPPTWCAVVDLNIFRVLSGYVYVSGLLNE